MVLNKISGDEVALAKQLLLKTGGANSSVHLQEQEVSLVRKALLSLLGSTGAKNFEGIPAMESFAIALSSMREGTTRKKALQLLQQRGLGAQVTREEMMIAVKGLVKHEDDFMGVLIPLDKALVEQKVPLRIERHWGKNQGGNQQVLAISLQEVQAEKK